MSDTSDPLDRFGRVVMERLRDRCIDHFDGVAQGRWKAPSLQPLQRDVAALSEPQRAIVRRCVIAAIDSAIHDFLFTLQEGADSKRAIKLIVDGQDVVPLSDGIHGEMFGPDGWGARFSQYGEPPETP